MDLYEFLKQRVQNAQGYIRFSHLNFTELGEGSAKAKVQVDEDLLNPMGTVHGGCLFSICDTVGGTAAMTHGVAVTTTMASISYLNPAPGSGILTAEAVELKAGQNLFRYDVFVRDEQGTLVCKAELEYFKIGKLDYS